MVIVQRQERVKALLDFGCNVPHQPVKGLGPFHQTHRENQFGIFRLLRLNGNFLLGKEISGAIAQLQGIPQIDRDGETGVRVGGGQDDRAGGQDPRGPGQMHRYRVNVNAGYILPKFAQNFPRLQPRRLARRHHGVAKMVHRCDQESAGTASRVQDALINRIRYHFLDHRLGQPRRGVVFPQLLPLVGRDDVFVEDGPNVRRRFQPVEVGNAAGQGLEKGTPANFRRPGKEVRPHNSPQVGSVAETPSVEQILRFNGRQSPQVKAKGCLYHHTNHRAEVGMADEQVIHLLRAGTHFPQGRAEQILPQPPLDLDRFPPGVGLIQGFKGVDFLAIVGATRAEVTFDFLPVNGTVFPGLEGFIPQPLVQKHPLAREFKGKTVRFGGIDRPGISPAQQPILAVRKNAQPYPAIPLVRLDQVTVQLLHIFRVGLPPARRANPPLHLNKGVQGSQVNQASGSI